MNNQSWGRHRLIITKTCPNNRPYREGGLITTVVLPLPYWVISDQVCATGYL